MEEIKHVSCGLMMYDDSAVFLGHPGGPYYTNKDDGVWGIPKGMILNPDENYFMAAKREFQEETGIVPPRGITGYIYLNNVKYGGKRVHCWAFRGEGTEKWLSSNVFTMEYPSGSGNQVLAPELDDGKYFSFKDARVKMNAKQVPFIDNLIKIIYNSHPVYKITMSDIIQCNRFADASWRDHYAHDRNEEKIKENIITGKFGEIAFTNLFNVGPVNFDNKTDPGWDFKYNERTIDIKTINLNTKERVYLSTLRAEIYALMFYDIVENRVIYVGKLSRLDIQHRKLLCEDENGSTYVDKSFFK